jgi:hypothetical protein
MFVVPLDAMLLAKLPPERFNTLEFVKSCVETILLASVVRLPVMLI